MPMTRREALIRAAGGASAFALSGTATAGAQEPPTQSAVPPGVVTLEDFEALAQRRVESQTFESFAVAQPTRSLCDGIATLSIVSLCVLVYWSTSRSWIRV